LTELPFALDPGSSLDRFFRGADAFFDRLGDIGWVSMSVALAFYLLHLLARTRAWQNVLRAAYPDDRVGYWRITGAYLAGAGLNSFIPARVGDAVKIFLAKRSIRGSSYPAIVSSFFVQSVFDITAGILVFLYALTQGLLPRPPELPRMPAFEISFWAEHPRFLIFLLTAFAIALVIALAILARRAEEFWNRIKQGVVVLTDFRRYVREVAAWQGAGWVMRFFSFWFFLEAFHIGGSFSNVMLVMSVQAVSTLLPLTPGGAGAQQALLVATLRGPGPIAVLTYSVGQQIAVAAWAALLGFVALLVIFRTTNWRDLIRRAGAEAEAHQRAEETGERSESSEAAREPQRSQPG
jgi:glycosyltransferase 2 family protein